MPVFEYRCRSCGKTMEFLEKTRTPRKRSCPKCGSFDLEKLLSGFAVGRPGLSKSACEACPTSRFAGGPCSSGSCPMLQ